MVERLTPNFPVMVGMSTARLKLRRMRTIVASIVMVRLDVAMKIAPPAIATPRSIASAFDVNNSCIITQTISHNSRCILLVTYLLHIEPVPQVEAVYVRCALEGVLKTFAVHSFHLNMYATLKSTHDVALSSG